MTTDRSYRKGRSPEAALAEMQANSGTQFDPAVVDALTEIIERDAAAARGGTARFPREPPLG